MQGGQHITPTIRLVRPLAQGAMGHVWVADHLALGTQVAVKLMAPRHAEHPEFAARFRREAQAAAQLRSPHVTQILDHGITAEGEPYIVMELLEGETLQRRLQRVRQLPLHQMAEALAAATGNPVGRSAQLPRLSARPGPMPDAPGDSLIAPTALSEPDAHSDTSALAHAQGPSQTSGSDATKYGRLRWTMSGEILVSFATEGPLNAREWDELIHELLTKPVRKYLVTTVGSGELTSVHRRQIAEVFSKKRIGVAVVTDKKIIRHMVTGISWLGVDIKPFSWADIRRAVRHLGVSGPDEERLIQLVDDLRRASTLDR